MENADPKSFVYMEGFFSKDKNSVFYEGKKIEGKNPHTFTVPE